MFKLMPKFVPKLLPKWVPMPRQRHRARSAPSATDAGLEGTVLAAQVIIADRGEFIDALDRLRRGHVLVRPRTAREGEQAQCLLDSAILYTAFEPLQRYGLISEYGCAKGFANMRYYRLTDSGRRFADRACEAWRQRPLLHRLAARLTG